MTSSPKKPETNKHLDVLRRKKQQPWDIDLAPPEYDFETEHNLLEQLDHESKDY